MAFFGSTPTGDTESAYIICVETKFVSTQLRLLIDFIWLGAQAFQPD